MTRTAPPMREIICDVARIRRTQQLLDAKPDSPQREAILVGIRSELEATYGHKPTWGNRNAVTKRDETPAASVTKPECDETPKTGRPKKYASRAEQAKAYRARKKAGK